MTPKEKKPRLTIADEIEIGLRSENHKLHDIISIVRANAEFVQAHSTNADLKAFATVMLQLTAARN